MARLNIEDSFFLEFTDVLDRATHLGQDKVIGNAIRFLRHAQEEHKKGKYVSEEDFRRRGFLEELIPTFAERTPSGIQAVGAKKYFGWLEQKIEAGRAGGQKSAQRPRDKNGRLLKKGSNENPQNDFIPSEPSDHQPSPSPSSSPSLNKKVSTKEVSVVVEEATTSEISEIDFGLEEPAQAPRTIFIVHQDLATETLTPVLQYISPNVQAGWVKKFELEWLKSKLEDAITYHMATENVENAAQINDWGRRLVGWIRREKKPSLIDFKQDDLSELRAFEAKLSSEEGDPK